VKIGTNKPNNNNKQIIKNIINLEKFPFFQEYYAEGELNPYPPLVLHH
jgi:hypothetical protein